MVSIDRSPLTELQTGTVLVPLRWNVPPGLVGMAGGFISTFSSKLARPRRPLPIYRYLSAHCVGVPLMELGTFEF